MKLAVTRFRQFVLLAGDIACFAIGLFLALELRYGFYVVREQFELHKFPFGLIFALWLLSFFIAGLYSLRKAKNVRSFYALFFGVFGINAAIAALVFYFIPYFSITPKTVLFLDIAITALLLTGWRALYNRFISLPPLKLAVLGSGKEVNELIAHINRHPQEGYKCVLHLESVDAGFADSLKHHEIDTVVVAIDYRASAETQKYLFECISLHIHFFNFVNFYERIFQKIPLDVINRAWFLENLNESEKQFFSLLKRTSDVLCAFILSIIGIILSPFIAIAIWIDNGSPIFYSQMRVGQFGKPFRIYKFRSMKSDNETVTKIGRLIRAAHLDEIPQLWNIIKGEMSFVGPRPEQVHFVSELTSKIPFYTERLLVRPGIAGWAQLHEPKAKVGDAMGKLQYDLFYIKHRSVVLDVEIILKTLRVLIA